MSDELAMVRQYDELLEDLEAARNALKPFAEAWRDMEQDEGINESLDLYIPSPNVRVTVGDLKRAAELCAFPKRFE